MDANSELMASNGNSRILTIVLIAAVTVTTLICFGLLGWYLSKDRWEFTDGDAVIAELKQLDETKAGSPTEAYNVLDEILSEASQHPVTRADLADALAEAEEKKETLSQQIIAAKRRDEDERDRPTTNRTQREPAPSRPKVDPQTQIDIAENYIRQVQALRRELVVARQTLRPLSETLNDMHNWRDFAYPFVQEQQQVYNSPELDRLPLAPLKLHLSCASGYLWNAFSELADGDIDQYEEWLEEIDGQLAGAAQELADLAAAGAAQKLADLAAKDSIIVEPWMKRWNREKHTWTDRHGNYSVEAVYDTYLGDGAIRLLKKDKSEVIMSISHLSQLDQIKALRLKLSAQQNN